MPWVQTWVTTVAKAFEAGVSRLTAWLFGGGRSQESIMGELHGRYPALPNPATTNVYNRMETSSNLAADATASQQMPDARTIPRDPSANMEGRYRYDIDYDAFRPREPGETGPGRQQFDRFFFHYSERPLSFQEIRQAAIQHAREQMAADTIVGGMGSDTVDFEITISLRAIWRKD